MGMFTKELVGEIMVNVTYNVTNFENNDDVDRFWAVRMIAGRFHQQIWGFNQLMERDIAG
jgi:hypothetical protein